MLRGRDICLCAAAGGAALLVAACTSAPATEAPFGPVAAAATVSGSLDAASLVVTRRVPAVAALRAAFPSSSPPLPIPPPRVAVYEDSSPRTGASTSHLLLNSSVVLPLPSAPVLAAGTRPRVEPRMPSRATGGASLLAGPTASSSAAPVASRVTPSSTPPSTGGGARSAAAGSRSSAALAAPVEVAASARPTATLGMPPELSQNAAPERLPASTPASERTYTRVGDPLELTLPGEGWIYLGDLRGQASGLSYRDRTIGVGTTSFIFRAQRLGEYLLEFQLQDHLTGGERRQYLNVAIVAPGELERILAAGGAPAESGLRGVEVARATERADSLYDDGLLDLALGAYQQAAAAGLAADDDLHLNDRLAVLYAHNKEWGPAEEHWTQIVGLAERALEDVDAAERESSRPREWQYLVDARLGLARSAIARGDAPAMAEMSAMLLGLPASEQAAAVVRDAAVLLRDAQLWEPALLVLWNQLRAGTSALEPELRFRLASVLESGWAGRDLREARRQYLWVAEQFPASRFAQPALDRVRYLDRHYFIVQ